MKSSTVKTIVVECKLRNSLNIKEYEVDSEIFEDPYMEAATRFAEQQVKKPGATITPILSTYDKKDVKNYDKHICYNSYYVVINAGYHKKAEIMRNNFKRLEHIDLKNESIKSNPTITNGNSDTN